MDIEKILRDTNLILNFLKENEDIALSLFESWSKKEETYVEMIEPFYFNKKSLDYLYKTRWLIADAESGLIGIMANNHIIRNIEHEFFYCCQGLQHFPYYSLNKELFSRSAEEYLETSFYGNVFEQLEEYEKFCKLEKICIQEYYQQFFNKDCKEPYYTDRTKIRLDYEIIENFEDDRENDRFEQQSLMFCYEKLRDNYKNKKTVQQYPEYPIIRREVFKPLTRLEQPRIIDFEEEYAVSSIDGIYWQD